VSEITLLAESLTEITDEDPESALVTANDVIVAMWKRGYQLAPRPPKIDVCLWEKERSPEGYMILSRRKTCGEVMDELRKIVGEHGPGHDEYLSLMLHRDEPFPEGRIVCFSVNGSSEGDYTHVEAHQDNERTLIFLGKTFDGRDASWAFARQLADIFEELA
jgi:hypothetical protein